MSDKKLFSRFRAPAQKSSNSRDSNSLSNIDEDESPSSRHRRSAPPTALAMEDADQDYLMAQYEYQKQQERNRRKSSSKPSSSRGRGEGSLVAVESMKSSGGNLSRMKSTESSGGEPTDEDAKEERRSKSRHRSARSKSRPRQRSMSRRREKESNETMEDDMQQLSITQSKSGTEGESLRDYWKRRAEENNEGKSSDIATSPPSRREGRERDLDKQLERHRARSKSRGRSVRDTPPERKKNVDSIASALGSHGKGKSEREEISPLHLALEKSDWNALNTTLMTLAKSGNSSDMAAQLSVSSLLI
jgi:hypothetical protein